MWSKAKSSSHSTSCGPRISLPSINGPIVKQNVIPDYFKSTQWKTLTSPNVTCTPAKAATEDVNRNASSTPTPLVKPTPDLAYSWPKTALDSVHISCNQSGCSDRTENEELDTGEV